MLRTLSVCVCVCVALGIQHAPECIQMRYSNFNRKVETLNQIALWRSITNPK
jgi:hypothetical protein